MLVIFSITGPKHKDTGKQKKQAFFHIHYIIEGIQKVFGILDLFVSLLETEIKYPIFKEMF